MRHFPPFDDRAAQAHPIDVNSLIFASIVASEERSPLAWLMPASAINRRGDRIEMAPPDPEMLWRLWLSEAALTPEAAFHHYIELARQHLDLPEDVSRFVDLAAKAPLPTWRRAPGKALLTIAAGQLSPPLMSASLMSASLTSALLASACGRQDRPIIIRSAASSMPDLPECAARPIEACDLDPRVCLEVASIVPMPEMVRPFAPVVVREEEALPRHRRSSSNRWLWTAAAGLAAILVVSVSVARAPSIGTASTMSAATPSRATPSQMPWETAARTPLSWHRHATSADLAAFVRLVALGPTPSAWAAHDTPPSWPGRSPKVARPTFAVTAPPAGRGTNLEAEVEAPSVHRATIAANADVPTSPRGDVVTPIAVAGPTHVFKRRKSARAIQPMKVASTRSDWSRSPIALPDTLKPQ